MTFPQKVEYCSVALSLTILDRTENGFTEFAIAPESNVTSSAETYKAVDIVPRNPKCRLLNQRVERNDSS